jgi:hypothetical protein
MRDEVIGELELKNIYSSFPFEIVLPGEKAS